MYSRIFDASVDEIKNGCVYDSAAKTYRCLFCEREFNEGEIYEHDGRMTDAKLSALLHVTDGHGSAFGALVGEDKKHTGLTAVQRDLMIHFYNKTDDRQIARVTGTSASTVRFQRYSLREKAKQAKIFLALFELMWERVNDKSLPKIHEGAVAVDERYMVTEDEETNILRTCFEAQEPPVLKNYPVKQKKELVVLRVIARRFEPGRRYTEKEVNEILKPIYSDFVMIRRNLIEYGFMDRTEDCGEYWLKGR